MLKHRVITALILAIITIVVLFFLPLTVFIALMIILCMMGAWEWGQFVGFKQKKYRGILAVVTGIILALISVEFLGKTNLYHLYIADYGLWIALCWWIVAFFLMMTYPQSATFWRNSKSFKLLFGFLTIIPFFIGMVVLRSINYQTTSYEGAWWLLYAMILVWGADSGAYVFGRLFGKNKLVPRVSPGKTWEGLCGGLITSAIIAIIFSYCISFNVLPLKLIICSIISVAASVLGDLTESMFKREAGIKDSGNILPGHGGILDRIDSLTAAVPVFACLMLLLLGAV